MPPSISAASTTIHPALVELRIPAKIASRADGIAISKDLVVGKYIVKEKETGEYYEINENDFEVEITKNGEVVGLTISNKSKTPSPEKPKEETPKIEVPPIEPIKKLPVTGY